MSKLDLPALKASLLRLGDTVLDPASWPDVMDEVSRAVGATGAVLLQSDNRTLDVPCSAGVGELLKAYFENGWHLRDIRAERCPPLLMRGHRVVTESDILEPRDLDHDPLYNELLFRFGFRWFAAVGFRSGDALWGLIIQRTGAQGIFTDTEKRTLATLSQRLTDVASLSASVGRVALSSATNALNAIKQAAIAVDGFGSVLDVNGAASACLGNGLQLRRGRLFAKDAAANAKLQKLFDKLRVTPDTASFIFDPIVIRQSDAMPLVLQVLPVHPAARTPFLGARALLLLAVAGTKQSHATNTLMEAFGLSRAETRVATEIADGKSTEDIALTLGVSRETVRTQLRAVFSKTGTHRQSELVALLNRL
jgi:DNA-binding CsgD family transcriptional regulator